MPQWNQSLEFQIEQLNQRSNDFFELQKESAEDVNKKLDKICSSFARLETLIRAEVIGLSTVVATLITLLVKIITLL